MSEQEKIKITRVYTFEGDREAVEDQLNRSWFKSVGQSNQELLSPHAQTPASARCLVTLVAQEHYSDLAITNDGITTEVSITHAN